MSDDKSIQKPTFGALLDGLKLSARAKAALVAAHRDAVRDARAEAEAACVPEAMVEAVTRAAAYGTRVGYLAAVRDCAQEQQKHGGEALVAANAALREEWDAQIDAPINRLASATVGAAQDAENAIRHEMEPRPENRARWSGPEPLAALAERARDAAAAATGGIVVRNVKETP